MNDLKVRRLCLRPEPAGPDQVGGVPAGCGRGEGVPAAPAVRVCENGRQDLPVQPEQGTAAPKNSSNCKVPYKIDSSTRRPCHGRTCPTRSATSRSSRQPGGLGELRTYAAHRSLAARLRRQGDERDGRRPEPDRLDRRLRRPRQLPRRLLRHLQRAVRFRNNQIFNILQKARTNTDQAKRAKLYEQANRIIMNYLPADSVRAHEPGARVQEPGEATSPARSRSSRSPIVSVGGI